MSRTLSVGIGCLTLLVVLSFAGCGGGGGAISPGDTTVSPATFGLGHILFLRAASGGPFLWVMNADGSSQTRLTGFFTSAPDWRPDGKKIAYVAEPGHALEIFVANPNGSGRTMITNTTTDNRDPAWSPDGTKIAFSSERGGDPNIYVMNADGSAVKQLTKGHYNEFHPTWSPDSTKIAFSSDRSGASNIWVVPAAGGALKRLTSVTGTDVDNWPEWAPNSSRIIFTSKLAVHGGRAAIYGLSPTGGTPTFVNWGSQPGWSPDAKQIVYVVGGDLFAMNANGTMPRDIANSALVESQPDWGP